jgi:ParB-like chromosome segregation protein Spo0J
MEGYMEIKQVKIKDLNPAPYNPRKWSDEAVAQLKVSISKFGFVEAVTSGCT